MALSSTTRTRQVPQIDRVGHRRRGAARSPAAKLAVKWKVLPRAGFALHPEAPAHQLHQL